MGRLVTFGIFQGMASLTRDWIQLAALVGALQGLLLSVVLVAQRKNRIANRLLAALMASFAIYLASSVYYGTGLVREFPHFFGISYQMPWVFGPLVFLYAVAASDRSWRFKPKTLLHFVPIAINTLATSPYYAMSGAEKIAMFDRWIAGEIPVQLVILDPFKYVSASRTRPRQCCISAAIVARSSSDTPTRSA
ncbi:MAG: hypothetical protein ACT4P6_21625 [Gemmatimonadaceae bacterium]